MNSHISSFSPAVLGFRERIVLSAPSVARVAALVVITFVAWKAIPVMCWYCDAVQAWESTDTKAMNHFVDDEGASGLR